MLGNMIFNDQTKALQIFSDIEYEKMAKDFYYFKGLIKANNAVIFKIGM